MQTQDILKVSRRKFHKTNMRIPQRVHEGNGAGRGEKGEVVAELHLPFPSHIKFTRIIHVIYNLFHKLK